jgi:long-chain acyl-CoA synthetase
LTDGRSFPHFRSVEVVSKRYKDGESVMYGKKNGEVFSVHSCEYNQNSYILAHALLELGITCGDRVATIIYNSPERNFFDMAISLVGAVQVPVYPTISEAQTSFIFNEASISCIIVSGSLLWDRIKSIIKEKASLKVVITIDPFARINSMSVLL